MAEKRPSPVPVFLSTFLVISLFVNCHFQRQISILRGQLEQVQAANQGRHGDASQYADSSPAFGTALGSLESGVRRSSLSSSASSETDLGVHTDSIGLVSESFQIDPSPETLLMYRHDSEMVVKRMESALSLSPELREKLLQYFFETEAGTRPPVQSPTSETGEVVDELELILGKERYTTWQNWQTSEAERIASVDIERQVSYLGQTLGLDAAGEQKLRQALQNPDQDSAKEASLVKRTLDLTSEQYEEVKSFWTSIDSEVTERTDALLQSRIEASGDPSLALGLGLTSEDYTNVRQEIIHDHLAAILSPEQLTRLPTYEALVAQ